MVFFIYSHSGYLSDSLDLEFFKIGYINPNTATSWELGRIPFLSVQEISMILTMRKEKPFTSTDDLARRIGLLPFEADFLRDVLYFGKKYNLWFYISYDTTLHYITNYLFDGKPIFSIWEHHKKTYFMNAVRTRYITLMQGYISPIFKGALLDNNYYVPRRDGIRRDTSYNFLLLSRYLSFLYSPKYMYLRSTFKGMVLETVSDSTKRHINGVLYGIERRPLSLKIGIKDKYPVFYTSLGHTSSYARTFYDIYSKYTDHRIYGAHLFMRTKIFKNLSLKTYGSYRHSYSSSLRFSLISQYKFPKYHTYLNLGIKKLYTSCARVYLSMGMWGKNYMYFSIAKDIGTRSYMLRYAIGLYNLSLEYMLSSNDADYIFLDETEGTYFMGRTKEKLRLRYRVRLKNYTVKIEYEKGEKDYLRVCAQGRIYH